MCVIVKSKGKSNEKNLLTLSSGVNAEQIIRNTVGCHDRSLLPEALTAINNGGFRAFLPYVSQGCILVLKNFNATIVKREFSDYKIVYDSPKGPMTLWVPRETFQ